MRKIRILFLLVSLLAVRPFVQAQDEGTIRQYIDTYKDLAIAEMQRAGVPASITLAQGIHETMAGTSDLVRQSNNHFGIKCRSDWTGESVRHDDDARGECFRKYTTPADSYKDHSDFLKNSGRYASLFTLDPMDYEAWAYGLKKAGYATNPRYPQIIIKLVEDYHLQDYTLIAMGKMQRGDESLARVQTPVKDQKAVADASSQQQGAENANDPSATVAQEKPDYPSGEFRINDTRVVYALKGTPVLSIAQQYNVPLARIFEFNEMNETETIEKDQLLYLQRKRKNGNNEIHIVKPGETLEIVAQVEAIRMESLLEYNNLARNARLTAGDQLYLRQKAHGNIKARGASNE